LYEKEEGRQLSGTITVEKTCVWGPPGIAGAPRKVFVPEHQVTGNEHLAVGGPNRSHPGVLALSVAGGHPEATAGEGDEGPRAVSAMGSYWFFGPGDLPGDVVISVGDEVEDLGLFFDEFTIVKRVENPWACPSSATHPSASAGAPR